MKRPQGFDGVPAETPEPPPRRRSSRPPRAPRPPRAVRKDTSRPERAPRRESPRVAAARAARELRREQKREIRRFTRRTRHRRATLLTVAGVIAALGAMLAVAIFSPLLSLNSVTVTGAVTIDEAELRAALSEQQGTPLALLDHEQIRRQLSAFPRIRSYVTEIVPPHTLTVHIVEREPVAALEVDGGYDVVDPAGVVLERSAERAAGVPVIGVGPDGVDSAGFTAVVEVLLALPSELRETVDTARATTRDNVTLVFTGVGQSVVWGSADRSALKAQVLARLVASQSPGAHIEYDVSAPLTPVIRPL